MSGTITMFPPSNNTKSNIPLRLPSPSPLRRSASLRAPSEKKPASLRRDANPNGGNTNKTTPNEQSELKRGYSFMERGEKRRDGHGARPPSIPGQTRPQHFKAEKSAFNSFNKGFLAPQSPSRIRNLSLSLSNTRLHSPKSPSSSILTSSPLNSEGISPGCRSTISNFDWDEESVTSVSSVASCDHATVARNGTTFSGRSMKYLYHCNQHAGETGEDYLTPTQRAHRQVRKLKHLLHQAKKDLEQKDSDILRLTKEVVELRLFKAALNSPEDKSNSSDAVTVKENASSEESSPEVLENGAIPNHVSNLEMNSSFADSGHFEDCTSSSIHSKDGLFDDLQKSPSKSVDTCDKGVSAFIDTHHDSEHSKVIMEYEKRLQELVKTHEDESYQLKQKHNDRIEELLQRITEINSRYWELMPELDTAKEKIKELEGQLEDASQKLEEQEESQKQNYLQMYTKGQEAARLEQENTVMELANQNPSRVSVPELLQELQVTKNELEKIKAMYRQLMEAKSKNKIDPEITLQFLKSAIYYFLTDRENTQGHLKAIQSILGFTSSEISNIDKARLT